MLKYAAIRCALLLPSLCIIAVLAFALSQAIPGDQAEALMIQQGISPDSKRAEAEYLRNYKSLGLENPIFYFSVSPQYYPTNIHSIISREERQLTRELLKSHFSFQKISAYLSARNLLVDSLPTLSESAGTELLKKSVFYAVHPDSLRLLQQQIRTKFTHSRITSPVADAISDMLEHRQNVYYPVLHWHGTSCRFHLWISHLARGDAGSSLRDGLPVHEKVGKAFVWTLFLAFTSLFVSLCISVPSGVLAGYYHRKAWDKVSHIVWMILYSMPVFWLASLLIVYFTSDQYGSWLHIFPLPGDWYIASGESFLTTMSNYAGQMILPVLCLVANDIAVLSRMIRNNTIAVKSKLYFLTALASGQSDRVLMQYTIFPQVLLPILTTMAARLPSALAGALIVEVIFGIPGMGRLMYQSITGADWPVVLGILMVMSLISMLVMLLTDLLNAFVNPKIRKALT